MRIIYDPRKREITLQERGLDFRDAAKVFAGPTLDLADEREDYGEIRYQTYGLLVNRLVMMVWPLRGEDRRIISMRYCHDHEETRFREQLTG